MVISLPRDVNDRLGRIGSPALSGGSGNRVGGGITGGVGTVSEGIDRASESAADAKVILK